jgi:threonine synthase
MLVARPRLAWRAPTTTMTSLSHLECSLCGARHEARRIQSLCSCGGPLLVRYDLQHVRENWSRDWLDGAPSNIWRYAPILPVTKPEAIVTLGEGFTPLVRARDLGADLGTPHLWIKDDGTNPTGTFKARGMSCAISLCRELGIKKVAAPSAGNAASALAAYAAYADIDAHIFMPADVPQANFIECKAYGAAVTLVDGLITDCARLVTEGASRHGWFDMATLKEPYRVEGKKTMGLEIAEQMQWRLPDAIFYPTGGGVGLIGMWKAFEELAAIGWLGKPGAKMPKMIAVQAEGCQPIVKAFQAGTARSEAFPDAVTLAHGLRVPKPLGDVLTLRALRASNGTAIAVSDQEMLDSGLELAQTEGLFASPEGASCVAALKKLLATGFIHPDERIVLYNTGTGLKYLEAYATRFPRLADSQYGKLGGLITPR